MVTPQGYSGGGEQSLLVLPSDNGTGNLMNRTSVETDDRFSVTQVRLMLASIVGCMLIMAMTIAVLSNSAV